MRSGCACAGSEFARYAEIAALVTGTRASTDGLYQPYEEIVRERYHDQTHTNAWIFPSALRHFDAPAIRELLDREELLRRIRRLCPSERMNLMRHFIRRKQT